MKHAKLYSDPLQKENLRLVALCPQQRITLFLHQDYSATEGGGGGGGSDETVVFDTTKPNLQFLARWMTANVNLKFISGQAEPVLQPTGCRGTWWTIQLKSSSCLFCGRPSWAVGTWAGTFASPSSVFSLPSPRTFHFSVQNVDLLVCFMSKGGLQSSHIEYERFANFCIAFVTSWICSFGNCWVASLLRVLSCW